jgi:hypothetical protein
MDNDLIVILGFVGLFIIIIMSGFFMLGYYSSCREASIFNIQHKTQYTCGDFFWAEDQINQGVNTLKLELNK